MQGADTPRTSVSSEYRTDQGSERGILDKDYILDAMASCSVGVPSSSLSFQDEAICSGYQYPLDDSLERNYRSDFFGHLPNSNPPLFKDSLLHRSVKGNENLHCHALLPTRGVAGTRPGMEISVLSKAASVDAAMALGAGRAAGLIPQTGAEAFNKVRTTIQPSMSKCIDNAMQTDNGVVLIHASLQKSRTADSAPEHAKPSKKGKSGALIFPHLSLLVAETRDTLHPINAASGAMNSGRVRQQQGKWYPRAGKEGLGSGEPSVAESTTTAMTGLGSCKEEDFEKQGTGASRVDDDDKRNWQLPAGSLPAYGPDTPKGKEVDMLDCFNSTMSASALTVTVSDTPNPAAASPTRGSDNISEKSGKEVGTASKRKVSQGDDSEYQSEDVEEVAENAKVPPLGRSSTSKRSRAAEIHNQSERRRRDRINERMKALQELIPNSNKTDKASMLDTAIEYLKILQSQVQMMSIRTGIAIPLRMIPIGMQHLQIPQMTTLPHVRGEMGMSMGMGVGVGCLGMGIAAGRGIVPVPSIPEQAIPVLGAPVSGFQPSVSSLSISESQQCLQSSSILPSDIMDHYNVLTCQEQPVHLNMNMDMCGAFWRQQQQLPELLQGISWSKSTE